jgi:uncharacterized protein YdhG (YjbR/CyaY superfamily)
MFKPTAAKTPEEYIAMIEDEVRRKEIQELHELIMKVAPKLEPHIVVGMIGYGSYHYIGKSGREGDWPPVSLASQKNYISLYVSCIVDGKYVTETFKSKLPKADIGKSCVRFKTLADVDVDTLKDLIEQGAKMNGTTQDANNI